MLLERTLHLIPPGTPGKSTLARALLGSGIRKRDRIVRLQDGGCELLVPTLEEPVGFHLFIDGVYEPETQRLIHSRMDGASVLVDLGANIGAFTVPAARKLGSSGRVLAVEASPRIFKVLQNNVTRNNLSNVSLLPFAVHDGASETVSFYEAPPDHFGMGSIAAQFHAEPITVPAKALDRMLAEQGVSRVDVLKADVEGNERNAFWGAKELLNGVRAPLVIFEFCDWAENRMPGTKAGDSQRLLLEWGYRLWKLEEFREGKGTPLQQPLEIGSEMLVAAK